MKLLITGTTRGIGKSIYDILKKEHDVYTVNRHPDTSTYNCDLSDLDAVEKLCEDIRKEEFDIIINNAGGSFPVPFESLSRNDIIERINLNFIAPVLIMQAVLPGMKQRGYGRIINISSVTAKTPVPYLHIYGAAKSALDSLTKSLSIYYSGCNICINSICPGCVETESSVEGRLEISRLRGESAELYQKKLIGLTGLNRMLMPEEISDLVKFLLCPSGDCISGQVINICGTMEIN